jgi:hypothetical protein
MPFGVLTVLPCRAAPGGGLAEPSNKPLALSRDESYAELLMRVHDACGAAPQTRVALAFIKPGGADELELSDDTQLCIALALLDDARQARR